LVLGFELDPKVKPAGIISGRGADVAPGAPIELPHHLRLKALVRNLKPDSKHVSIIMKLPGRQRIVLEKANNLAVMNW
jgi:hypothetical protein